jgi:Domain of unknown function (DUF4336)
VGGFGETAFFHRSTNTLLVTDAVIKVENEPPAIIQDDPRALLFHARDKMTDPVSDSKQSRQRGWRRMALFGLVFFPAGIEVTGVKETFSQLDAVPEGAAVLGQGAIPIDPRLYAWKWYGLQFNPELSQLNQESQSRVRPEISSFKALQGGLLVAPILQKLILNREPGKIC